MSRTGLLARSFGHAPEPAPELRPQEFARGRWSPPPGCPPTPGWLAAREALRASMKHLGYAACVPFGREPDGRIDLLLCAAHVDATAAEALPAIEAALGLSCETALRHVDARQGRQRAMQLGADGRLQAFGMAADASVLSWVNDQLHGATSARAFGQALLSGAPSSPRRLAPKAISMPGCARFKPICTAAPSAVRTTRQWSRRCSAMV